MTLRSNARKSIKMEDMHVSSSAILPQISQISMVENSGFLGVYDRDLRQIDKETNDLFNKSGR